MSKAKPTEKAIVTSMLAMSDDDIFRAINAVLSSRTSAYVLLIQIEKEQKRSQHELYNGFRSSLRGMAEEFAERMKHERKQSSCTEKEKP